jgi:Tol biopolymer transport system component
VTKVVPAADDPALVESGSFKEPAPGRRVDSWKEIAAHLKRDVATVRRWEKREGLPVHRHLHDKLGSVFAYVPELDAWQESRRQQVETVVPGRTSWNSRLVVGVALALALMFAIILWSPWRGTTTPAPLRLYSDLGADAPLAPLNVQFGDAAALSADGTVLAFVAQKRGGSPQLYVRRLNQLQAVLLPGTEDAISPFFSPDGRWIGFFAHNKLQKIAVTGGAAITLADAPSTRGGSWSEDDSIVFSPNQIAGTRLLRVSAVGGQATPLTALARGEVIHAWPQVLPGGKALLYTSSGVAGAYNDANIVVQALPDGLPKVVQRGGFHGRYVASGHLLYVHEGNVFAIRFDVNRLETVGEPVLALEGVNSNVLTGGAQFTSSTTGTLVYLPGPMTGAGNPISWLSDDGRTAPLETAPANWLSPRFSPDGTRLAMEIRDAQASDVWILDAAHNKRVRLTSDPAPDQRPVWTPDGRRIVFASTRADQLTLNLYWQRADGSGEAQRLTNSKNPQSASSWHPGGRFLAFEEKTAEANSDIMILRVDGDDAAGWRVGTPTAFLHSSAPELDPTFSPDGRWLAYVSLESGRPEVYVRPFPGPGNARRIGAGANPTWSQIADDIFYGVNGQIMVASYATDGRTFRSEEPRLWSERRYQFRGTTRMFDLHPDGKRFALAPATEAGTANQDKVIFVFSFFDELLRIVK